MIGFSLTVGRDAASPKIRAKGKYEHFTATWRDRSVRGAFVAAGEMRRQCIAADDGWWLITQGQTTSLQLHEGGGDVLSAELMLGELRRKGTRALSEWTMTGCAIWFDGYNVHIAAAKTPGRPVYFAFESDGAFHAASEILALGTNRLQLLEGASNESRQYGRPYETAFHDVYCVPAGTYASISLDRGEWRIYPYWLPSAEPTTLSEEAAVTRIQRDLRNAVGAMRGQPLICMLSGGLDSSLVASLAKEAGAQLTTYSVGTPARNEFAEARLVANWLGSTHHELVIEDAELLNRYAETVALVEHPYAKYIEYLVPGHVALSCAATPGATVLSGYGSDVLFAGFARGHMSASRVHELVVDEYTTALWANECAGLLGAVHGVEVLYPYFDPALVSTSFSVPPDLKYRDGWEKWVLRRAAESVLPQAVAWRRKVGIHESTGMTSYVDKEIGQALGSGAVDPETVQRWKTRATLEILRMTHVQRLPVEAVSLRDVVRKIQSKH